jgi:hypothetical protein
VHARRRDRHDAEAHDIEEHAHCDVTGDAPPPTPVVSGDPLARVRHGIPWHSIPRHVRSCRRLVRRSRPVHVRGLLPRHSPITGRRPTRLT